MYIFNLLSLSLYLPFSFTFVSPFVFLRQAQTEYKPALSLSLHLPLLLCLYLFVFWRQAQLCKSVILFFFAFFLLCLSFWDEHNCVNLPANDFPPRGMAATQCFLPSHYHPERQQKRSVGFFNDKKNKTLLWGGQYISVPLIQSKFRLQDESLL